MTYATRQLRSPFGAPAHETQQRLRPRAEVRPFQGPMDTLRQMSDDALGPRGEQSVLVREFTEGVIREVHPKDYLGEILAIGNLFVQYSPWRAPGQQAALFRYTNDPRHVELIKDPERLCSEILDFGSTLCDCDESACMAGTMCLVIGREVEFVAMGFAPESLSHVAVRVKEPKSGRWIYLDGVAGPREAEAASKAEEILYTRLPRRPGGLRPLVRWSLD